MDKVFGMSKPLKIFISYSHNDEDEEYKRLLKRHLQGLVQQNLLDVWDDSKIRMGDDWLIEIENELAKADIAIFLVSTDFLSSDFIQGKEVPDLLERREKNGTRLIPLVVRPCVWKYSAWLNRIQHAAPADKPLSGMSFHKKEETLTLLVEEIFRLCEGEIGVSGLVGTDFDSITEPDKSPNDGRVETNEPSVVCDADDSIDIKAIASELAKDNKGLLVFGLANAFNLPSFTANASTVAHKLTTLSPEEAIVCIREIITHLIDSDSDTYDAKYADELTSLVNNLLLILNPMDSEYILQLKERLDSILNEHEKSFFLNAIKKRISSNIVFSDDLASYIYNGKQSAFEEIVELLETLTPEQIKEEKIQIVEVASISIAFLYVFGAITSRFYNTVSSMMSAELALAQQSQSVPDLICSDSGSDMTRVRGRRAIHEDEINHEPGIMGDQMDEVVGLAFQAATVSLNDKIKLMLNPDTTDREKWVPGLDKMTAARWKKLSNKNNRPYFVSDENNLHSIFRSRALIDQLQKRYPHFLLVTYDGNNFTEEEAGLSLSLNEMMEKLEGKNKNVPK